MKYEEIGKGIVKRREQRILGLFIDGTGLDRATRRLNRKVDMAALVRGVTSGLTPVVARYYTLIPYEDDSRQRAFLDAVARAGMKVIVKRLPPKGVTRQVSVDVEMAADIAAFALGHSTFSSLSEYRTEEQGAMELAAAAAAGVRVPGMFPAGSSQARLRVRGPSNLANEPKSAQESMALSSSSPSAPSASVIAPVSPVSSPAGTPPSLAVPQHRVVTVVCPGRDLSYAIALAKELGADTVTADFGQFNSGDVLKSAAKWIDLSDSETIWRDL